MTTKTIGLCFLVGVVAVFGFAAPASAQVVVTAFVDHDVDGSHNGYVQAWLADESDFDAWPGAFHYDYYGYASISGPSGTYNDGSPYNPVTVSFPIASEVEEEDWVVEVALSFICSVAGPQEGPTDPIQAKSFNFQLHYSYSDMIGQTHKYIPRFSMGPRKCAFLEVDSNIYWGFQMTAIGFGFELLGNGKCIRNCTSNWIYPVSGPTTSSWPPGVGFCANGQ